MYRVQFCNIFPANFYTVSFNLGEVTMEKINAYFCHNLPFLVGVCVFFSLFFLCFNTSATSEIVTVNYFVAKRTFCVGSGYFSMS